MSGNSIYEFDLQPDPRILPMLGEINLAPWRCMAELVDNSIDGFLGAKREEAPVDDPEVSVNLPSQDHPNARVTISDNGPGMTPELLEKAVRAGWSGNNPIDSLGMFGMGFNISTARLGSLTTVWTSRRGDAVEHGLRIDFELLRRQRHFKTPHLVRQKSDPLAQGTSIIIERLKPEQRAWLSKPGNRSSIRRELAKTYAAMLRPNGVPISFTLLFNGNKIPGSNHCVWGEDRFVQTSRHGIVYAVQKIDRRLPDRPFCASCWQWLPAGEGSCPACGLPDHVVQRTRHVHGWIGLQRYLSSTSYGIDFIRNGRKIEIGNRDLFFWRDGENTEMEYPIDDPRQRGRFVGEIHLDHCRVTYTKDRFDRTDPAWEEMVGIVRGEGPLQPQKAASLGFSYNESPLFKLYQAFRRSTPPNARQAGGWVNVLAVKDNDLAEEMAKKFHEGDPEYQTDEKWWELAVEEDNKLLTPGIGGGGANPVGSGGGLPGFGDGAGLPSNDPGPPPSSPDPISSIEDQPKVVYATRTPIASLSREYHEEKSNLRFSVQAFEVDRNDPALGGASMPWRLSHSSGGVREFLVNIGHSVFLSATLTPLDALLCHLAHLASDFLRDRPDPPLFPEILADLRDRYAGTLKLDAVTLSNNAHILFRDIARSLSRQIGEGDGVAVFGDLASSDQETIHHRMAARAVKNPQQVIAEGRFLEYAPPRAIRDFILRHPELFFDGRCWDEAYANLDYVYPAATEEARSRITRYYEALLTDASWLTEQEPGDLELAPRERVLRAALAVELLRPTFGEGDDPIYA